MRKWLALLFSLLALGLVATGCGGDDDEEEPAQKTEPTGGAAETVEVSMKDIRFQPKSVTVSKGGTVKWTNEDSVGHDVTKEGGAGADFKSGAPGNMGQGDTFEQRFDTPGEAKYVCTVHPGMEGTVVVK